MKEAFLDQCRVINKRGFLARCCLWLMSKYTTELFRSWENGVRNEQETHWIVPKGNAKAVTFKREQSLSYATCCAGYDIMAGAKSHVKGPNWRTWNKYESGLIVGEGIPVFSGEKRSQSSPNVSLTQFLSHSWTPPFSYIYAASLLCVVVLYWGQKALHHFRRAEDFEPLSRYPRGGFAVSASS